MFKYGMQNTDPYQNKLFQLSQLITCHMCIKKNVYKGVHMY